MRQSRVSLAPASMGPLDTSVALFSRSRSVGQMFMFASGRITGQLPKPIRTIQINTNLHHFTLQIKFWFPDHRILYPNTEDIQQIFNFQV
jgi:hypothetical protein